MLRRAALAAVLLLLAACGGGDGRAPFVESRIPPSLSPRFWAPDGWAWGLLKVGDAPAQRYGVSSTASSPRANLLILTDDQETAEVWFETARDLNTQGFTVWVLERSGQGGSERYGGPRDLIHVPTFDDDIATTKALARNIVQGAPNTPLVIIGQGIGSLVAISAVQSGAPAATLILSGPTLAPTGRLPNAPSWLMKAGLGRFSSSLGQGWKRSEPGALKVGQLGDRQRWAVQMAWQIANPDLRMGGHSLGWTSAFASTSKATMADLKSVTTETYMLTAFRAPDGRRNYDACALIPRCTVTGIEPRPATTLGDPDRRYILGWDAVRQWWLHQISCSVPENPLVPEPPRARPCPMDAVHPTLGDHGL